MNSSAIYSKTGKGVQEASGKTSHLSRADRTVLAAIDGKTNLGEVAKKFEKLSEAKFDALIQQLDKDGFVREVSSGSQSAPTPARPAPPSAKAPPPKPSAGDDSDEGLDFTQALKLPPKAPAPKPPSMDLAAAARAEAERKLKDQELDYKARQEAELRAREAAEAKAKAEADAKVKAAREAAVRMATEAKARAEAEAKAKADAAEREKARVEAELNAKLDAERKAREDAERRAAEAAEQARKDLEEKAKRDAEEMRQRLEAEMKAKLDAERKAREEEDRKRREEEDRKRKEEDERRAKEDAERRAREEADRKKREEEDRKRKEEDERRRKEEDERRAKQEAERKAREEADRRKREEEDRKRKDEDERRAKEDAERKARDEAEAKARAAASASLPAIEPVVPVPPVPPPAPAAPAAPAASSALGDDLLADLDNFGKQEEEEHKAKEEEERKAKEAAARKAKEAAERKAREEAEAKRREEEERRRKAEEEQRAQEEAERKAREEEERRKEEEEERKSKAKEALAAKQAAERAAKSGAKGGDDVDVRDDDVDMDDIKRDSKVLAKGAASREQLPSAVVAATGRPNRWGKPVAIAVFALLVVGIGALHVVPVSTVDYEKGASEALGVPVKIGSARLSVITGVELKFENVAIGDATRIRLMRGIPDIGSLFGGRKSFGRVELEGVTMAQSQIADAVLGKAAGANFRVGRVMIKQLTLDGPLKLPPLDVDAAVSGDGSVQSVKLTGNDKLSVQISPKGSEMAFEISAGSLALPFVPALNLSDFGMKGTANRTGITSAEFDGRAYDGVISGTARIQWGANWSAEGEVRARAVKIAVFAPALVSEGKVEGRAAYTMRGSAPGQLYESARMQGEFKIDKGVLGSFDLTRALQTGGAQSAGRTVFNELKGQGVYDKGTIQLRDISVSAGAMNAGASIDIDANGRMSGRIAADVKTPNQTLRAVLNISGKVQDPVIRK